MLIPSELKKPIWAFFTILVSIYTYLDYSKNKDLGIVIYILIVWLIATGLFFYGKKKIF